VDNFVKSFFELRCEKLGLASWSFELRDMVLASALVKTALARNRAMDITTGVRKLMVENERLEQTDTRIS
jgi:hypothetical protein